MDRRKSARIAAACSREPKVARLEPEVNSPTANSRRGLKLKQLQESDYQPDPGKEDWRLNQVVVKTICQLLPAGDIKSVRLVCKKWAVVGSVPLTQKSKVSGSITHAQECLDFVQSPTFATGFRLRNFVLDWYCEEGPRSSFLKVGGPILRSAQFQNLRYLQINYCHFQIIAKYMLPFFLPTYWRNLKSLHLPSSDEMENTCSFIGFKEPTNGYPELNLEKLGMRVMTTYGYNWEFLRKCSKLKDLTFETVDYRRGESSAENREMKLQQTSSTYEQVLAALRGKRLEALEFKRTRPSKHPRTGASLGTEFFEMVPLWTSFYRRLILFNAATIRHVMITARSESFGIRSLFQDIPDARDLPRLESLKLECLGRGEYLDEFETRQPHTPLFYEMFTAVASKGYLESKNVELAFEPSQYLNVKSGIRMVSDKSASQLWLTVDSDIGKEKLKQHIPQGFAETMSRIFPKINYVCRPHQVGTVNFVQPENQKQLLWTALFERLGSDGVFDIPSLKKDWKKLDCPKDVNGKSELLSEMRWCFRRTYTDVMDAHSIQENAMASLTRVSEFYNAVVEDDSNMHMSTYGSEAVYLFGSIPNMQEAWCKKARSADWSTIPKDDFVPAVVENGRGAYAMCRMFQNRSFRGTLEEETCTDSVSSSEEEGNDSD